MPDGPVGAASTSPLPLSVVISTRNRPRQVLATLGSLMAGQRRPADIVVVDQSDADDPGVAAFVAGHAGIRRILTPARGLSRGRNEGMAATRCPLVALIDDDVDAPPGWAEAMVAALRQEGPGTLVSGRVLPGAPPGDADGWVPSTKTSLAPEHHTAPTGVDVLWGNHFGLWRDAIGRVGPFDTRLGPGGPWASADDNDYGYRALRAGLAVAYRPDVTLTHVAWRSGRELYSVQWDYGRGQGGFYAKHAHWGNPLMLRRLLRDAAHDLAGIARYGARGDRWAASYALHLAGLVGGFVQWRVRRPVAT